MQDSPTTRKTLVKLAKEIATDYGINFDFSEKSIKGVDTILEDIHRDLSKSPGNTEKQQGAYGIALEMAAYIIEVIELRYGKGVWEKDSEEYGLDSWPYVIHDITIFPVGWCVKRLENGRKDKVWRKYNTFLGALKK